jgi:hypothetical protein
MQAAVSKAVSAMQIGSHSVVQSETKRAEEAIAECKRLEAAMHGLRQAKVCLFG